MDEAMESIATDWVEEQTKLFKGRIENVVEREPWEPVRPAAVATANPFQSEHADLHMIHMLVTLHCSCCCRRCCRC